MRRHLIFLLALLFTTHAIAANKFAGTWEGKLKVNNTQIALVFHIKEENGVLSATMDSPDQGQVDIAVSSVTTKGDSIFMGIAAAGITYEGVLKERQAMVDGHFMQAILDVPMALYKTDNPTRLVRSQTPKPPFDYQVEDVTYYNADKSVKFGATITIPKGKGPFPAMILLTGSGQQNRDEEIHGHKPFAVIANYLTNLGYVVLRADDRGINKTTGDVFNATTKDFADDAEAGLAYLKSRPEVDKNKLGMLGHSEGALIATMVAAKRKDIDFIILLAGPGVPITQMMEEQTAAVFKSNGADSAFVANYRVLYRNIAHSIITARDSNDARQKVKATIETWKSRVPMQTAVDMGLTDPKSTEGYIQSYINLYNNKWYNYFLHINPQEYIEKLNCKVLVLNGEKDIQVVSDVNLQGFRESLKKAPTKTYEVKELKGLNHLFQTCNVCIVVEYALLDETFSRMALREIGTWLETYVK